MNNFLIQLYKDKENINWASYFFMVLLDKLKEHLMKICRLVYFCLVFLTTVFYSTAYSVAAPSRSGQMGPVCSLEPVFYENAACAKIASEFGSRTRYDGSQRPVFRFGGRHGGIDLTLAEGTPLLALAGGTVIARGAGQMMEGNYMWLCHAPEDTGLSYWMYTKYQHIQSFAEVKVGDTITVGQVVAYSGKTGTTGKHYGNSGYPHLHFSVIKSNSGNYEMSGSRVTVQDAVLIDPLWVYHDTYSLMESSSRPPVEDHFVLIPVVTEKEDIRPAGAKVVWPVACPE